MRAVLGIIFAIVGGLLLWNNAEMQCLSIDYTNCTADI
jgi:hypothetical protein